MAKQSNGLVSRVWTHSTDGKEGVDIVAFSGEDDAQTTIDQWTSMGMRAGSPVTIDRHLGADRSGSLLRSSRRQWPREPSFSAEARSSLVRFSGAHETTGRMCLR
jgi:hypothetical protein